ncbi:NAD-dependent epimerase/dehydratase family protein [Phenylobacterium aquaticum]|uniref:NAD-dependent epimerase/dehydratase family protein n=1 Tax=Phenylobacterium aquaticum TaxID=1763816 RepID=UPI001F5D1E06|nr:NAD-dependent epimerase/dehydratase family protein [Phenylobacterium aquaticum]MCI3135245.1 NAD-dependent epimerase/dehydratase family protein [Phenylobacterium aquaticum]
MPKTRRDIVQLSAALALAGAPALAAPPPRRLKILILGGTGFIGPHQVRYALSRGHQVTLFNRGKQPKDWPGEVEELIGDRNTGDLKALEGRSWDVCIDNPTTLPFWVRDAGRVLKGKVGQYVFVSTISVYAADDRPADETAALAVYKGADPMAETAETLKAHMGQLYGPLKALSEAEAARWFGSDVTVVRPGLIAGPGDETDRFTYWPVRLARGGEVLAPGDGKDPVQFIDARDLAEWIIRVAEQKNRGVFNATGPARPLTVAQMLAGVAKGVKADPKLTWVAADFLDAQNVSGWTDLPVWVPGQGETAGFAKRDIGRALAAGLTFRPLPTTAADTLAWFRSLPPERQAKPRNGLSPEREAQVLAAWKARG